MYIMAEIETQITKHIIESLSPWCWLHRNHVGRVQDSHKRWHSFGLGKGSPDLVGYTKITITPDMVGKQVAVFTGIEVKTSKGVVADHQVDFIDNLVYGGAIAGVARSCKDAYDLVMRYKNENINKKP